MVTDHITSDSDSDYQPSSPSPSPPHKSASGSTTPLSRSPAPKTPKSLQPKMKLSSLVTAATIPAPGNLEHKRQKIYGKKMSILTINGQKYMIGVQIASLLQRETYNLYRSMKVKKITVVRASPEQVDYLLKTNVVKPGTRSITFIPIDQGMNYITEEIKKVGLRKKSKDKSSKPYTVERSKLSKPSTPPPMILAELEMEMDQDESEQEGSQPSAFLPFAAGSNNEEDPFAVLCAAAEDEYNTQANTLTLSATSLPFTFTPAKSSKVTSELPTQTSSTLPSSPSSISSPSLSLLTSTLSEASKTPSTTPKLGDLFPFVICGVASQDNSVYRSFGDTSSTSSSSSSSASLENPSHRAAVLGR